MSVSPTAVGASPAAPQAPAAAAALPILLAISASHLINDTLQSVIPAIYPILKASYALDFGQIGMIQLAFQLTASLLQPAVGLYTDHSPKPYSLPVGMACTLLGLLLLAVAGSYGLVLLSVALIGVGSSIFHPEASRVARMASGGRHGFAQSLFQVGGNFGSALGPLVAALIILPRGQGAVAWVALLAVAGVALLGAVGRWYQMRRRAMPAKAAGGKAFGKPSPQVLRAIAVLCLLIFSKFFYTSSIHSYYTFYLIDRFHLPVAQAQLYLFVFLAAVAVGTLAGGPIGDRWGRRRVIWFSILGVLPFTLALPYANLFWTVALTVPIGLILSSAFPAIVVYAQELVPGKVGMIAGLFFGFAFGMGGVGAAALGELADHTSIAFVYKVCSFLPLIGLLAWLLPDLSRPAVERR